MKISNQQKIIDFYEKFGINSSEVVNCHVHLPELNEGNIGFYNSEGHAMMPKAVLSATLPLLKPSTFIEKYRSILGRSIVLPVGAHNFDGKASPLYASNSYVLDLSHKFPESVIPFGSFPLNLSCSDIENALYDAKKDGIMGVKYHAVEGYALKDCYDALGFLEELSLPLVVHLGDTPFEQVDLSNADPKMLIPIANKFPKLRMLITHFATPLHFDAFWVASRYKNIYMDTAEYPVYWTAHADNPYGPLLSPLHTKRVGVDKIIFGTDFPMPTFEKTPSGYITRVHNLEHYLLSFLELPKSYFTDNEKKQVLCDNYKKFLGNL
jgi:predicted TIM-barrel fold metal-dependent hydrolase